jgi:alkanesulfonate monooxygenase SsuD/methylene tetrahydromethanopterin reductase-like flavin-dependent oxidoreductase (luciferase family)
LSGGRLRLGIGVGWNPVEYAALGQDFTTRGTRSEEQIALLRQLWAASAIDFAGRWDTVTGAGINPLPPRGSIPIWIGGYADATLRRVATLGEGWFPWIAPDEKARAMLEQLRAYTLAAGRNPAALGIDARLSLGQLDEHQWAGYAAAWRALGATHLSINTMGAGFATPQAHIDGLRRAREVLGL